MLKNDLAKLYALLCSSFETASVLVFAHDSSCLFDRFSDGFRFGSPQRILRRTEATTILVEGKSFFKIEIPLDEEYQLLVCMPDSVFPDVFTPVRMIDSIIRAMGDLHQDAGGHSYFASQSDYVLFLDQLFSASTASQITYTSLLATKLGIDLSLNRVVCLVQFSTQKDSPDLSSLSLYSLVHSIRCKGILGSQDILGVLGSNQILFCPCCNPGSFQQKDLKNQLVVLYQELSAICSTPFSISVGLFAQQVPEYGQSFFCAQSALPHIQEGDSMKLVFSEDYPVEYMLKVIPKPILDHFFGSSWHSLQNNPVLFETIEQLVLNDMDIYCVAKQLKVHRNTVVFRINQIKKLFDLNFLHHDNDRFKLILIYLYNKLYMEKIEGIAIT